MASRVAFSNQNVDITEHALHHIDLENALRLYFSPNAPSYVIRFAGSSPSEVAQELQSRLDELDLSSALTILGAVEAALRVDYLQRCYEKHKDTVSRKFRDIFQRRGAKASLDEDILKTWQLLRPESAGEVIALRHAFAVRHWLAHGRYWVPKWGTTRYDYTTVYTLAVATFSSLPLVA